MQVSTYISFRDPISYDFRRKYLGIEVDIMTFGLEISLGHTNLGYGRQGLKEFGPLPQHPRW